jgi:hypothetical protein
MPSKYILLLSVFVGVKSATTFLPTSPGIGDVFEVGSDCPIKWDIDTTGLWTNVSIGMYFVFRIFYLPSGTHISMI